MHPSTMYRILYPIRCIVLYRYTASVSTSCASIYNTRWHRRCPLCTPNQRVLESMQTATPRHPLAPKISVQLYHRHLRPRARVHTSPHKSQRAKATRHNLAYSPPGEYRANTKTIRGAYSVPLGAMALPLVSHIGPGLNIVNISCEQRTDRTEASTRSWASDLRPLPHHVGVLRQKRLFNHRSIACQDLCDDRA